MNHRRTEIRTNIAGKDIFMILSEFEQKRGSNSANVESLKLRLEYKNLNYWFARRILMKK